MYKIHKETKLLYKTVCPRCNSEFEYDNEEIIYYHKGSNPEEVKFVDCPICGYSIDFNPNDSVGLLKKSENDSIETDVALNKFKDWINGFFNELD